MKDDIEDALMDFGDFGIYVRQYEEDAWAFTFRHGDRDLAILPPRATADQAKAAGVAFIRKLKNPQVFTQSAVQFPDPNGEVKWFWHLLRKDGTPAVISFDGRETRDEAATAATEFLEKLGYAVVAHRKTTRRGKFH